ITVEGVIAPSVGVPVHLDVDVVRVFLNQGRHAAQQPVAHAADDGAVGGEMNLVVEHDLVANDSNLIGIGAAVVIGVVVEHLWFIRAGVLGILDAILVVIRIGTAILILKLVMVLRFERALVLGVRHAVTIVVEIRAAVLVLETFPVLRLHGAMVDVIEDAVPIVIVFGASVPILIIVKVFRDRRTRIL